MFIIFRIQEAHDLVGNFMEMGNEGRFGLPGQEWPGS